MSKIWRENEQSVLAEHGVTFAEWAILGTAGYYFISWAKPRFIHQAVWESRGGTTTPKDGDLNEQQVAEALESCLSKGWAKLTTEGHEEPERTVLGVFTGDSYIYPKDGVVLTEVGYDLHSRLAIAIFGRDFFWHQFEEFEPSDDELSP